MVLLTLVGFGNRCSIEDHNEKALFHYPGKFQISHDFLASYFTDEILGGEKGTCHFGIMSLHVLYLSSILMIYM